MRTMVGIGPRPSDFHEAEVESESVYLLTRRRSSIPPPPTSSRNDDAWFDDPDTRDDISDIRPISRLSRRQRGIRGVGVLALAGALAGGTFVLQQPKVRHEAISFITLGHEQGASRVGRRIASMVEGWRQR